MTWSLASRRSQVSDDGLHAAGADAAGFFAGLGVDDVVRHVQGDDAARADDQQGGGLGFVGVNRELAAELHQRVFEEEDERTVGGMDVILASEEGEGRPLDGELAVSEPVGLWGGGGGGVGRG